MPLGFGGAMRRTVGLRLLLDHICHMHLKVCWGWVHVGRDQLL